MKTKHTPGPWTIEQTETTNFILQGEDSDQIAQIDRAFGDANARLIAAAPELLEACIRALHEIQEGNITIGCEEDLSAAIAKAKEE